MPSSETDILTNFSALDELIQVIYQGAQKFVVISTVNDVSWTLHLGLTGLEGRWWRGRWTEKDVRDFVVRILPTLNNRFIYYPKMLGTRLVCYPP